MGSKRPVDKRNVNFDGFNMNNGDTVKFGKKLTDELNSVKMPLNTGKQYEEYTAIIVTVYDDERFVVQIEQEGVYTYGHTTGPGKNYLDVSTNEIELI